MGDLTLIGTGSEWFWTMVSGLVVAVTFIVIFRQLKAQGAANAFQRIETVHGRWGSPELVLARLHVARALRDGTLDADDTRVDAVLNFFELVRDLNRQGYLDDEEIARSFGAFIVVWWRLLEPVIRAQASLEGRSRNVDRAAGARGNCSRIRQPARRRPRVRPDDADQGAACRA